MKKISMFFLALVLFLSVFSTSPITTQAESILDPIVVSDEVIVNIQDEPSDIMTASKIKLPNAVAIRVIPSETGLTIKVNNIGIDLIDKVTVKINHTQKYGFKGKAVPKTVTFTKIPPAMTKTKTMSIPMVRTSMSYTGNVTIQDGKQIAYKNTSSSLSFQEKQLNQDWLKGTFKNVRTSLDYHFDKHHTDKYVKASNMGQYLRMAKSAQIEMRNISKSNNTYTVGYPKSNSKKVKNKKTKKYVLINKTSKKLYSFGGR